MVIDEAIQKSPPKQSTKLQPDVKAVKTGRQRSHSIGNISLNKSNLSEEMADLMKDITKQEQK